MTPNERKAMWCVFIAMIGLLIAIVAMQVQGYRLESRLSHLEVAHEAEMRAGRPVGCVYRISCDPGDRTNTDAAPLETGEEK